MSQKPKKKSKVTLIHPDLPDQPYACAPSQVSLWESRGWKLQPVAPANVQPPVSEADPATESDATAPAAPATTRAARRAVTTTTTSEETA